jgi:crossover junction endodeoxyribonuclease RuvC
VTGWGVVAADRGEVEALGYGAIRPPARAPLADRLVAIFRELSAVIARYGASAAAVETPFVPRANGGSNRSALGIGQALAVAMLAAGEAGLTVAEYAPAEVKLTVAGYGRGDKAQIQRMVCLQLGLAAAPEPPDAADALAVALCHALRSRAAALAEVTP